MRMIMAYPLALALAAGCATPPQLGDEQQAITGGSIDSSDPTVGLFWRPDNREACTGTMITKNVVLTAAHCLQDMNVGAGTRPQFYTGTGYGGYRSANVSQDWDPSRDSSLTAYNVLSWYPDPGFVDGCPNKNDTALLLLDRAVPGPFASLPASGATLPAVGSQLGAVGYGDNGSGLVGQKRSANETLYAIDATDLQLQYGNAGNAGFVRSGDSGGPLLYNNSIIGTVMCHNSSDSIEYYQRIDQELAFINSTVAAWQQQCVDECGIEYGDCGSSCICLADYYDCERSCGKSAPVISCIPHWPIWKLPGKLQ